VARAAGLDTGLELALQLAGEFLDDGACLVGAVLELTGERRCGEQRAERGDQKCLEHESSLAGLADLIQDTSQRLCGSIWWCATSCRSEKRAARVGRLARQ
jgi:hypothetical protein